MYWMLLSVLRGATLHFQIFGVFWCLVVFSIHNFQLILEFSDIFKYIHLCIFTCIYIHTCISISAT